jgi:hypothetical protein
MILAGCASDATAGEAVAFQELSGDQCFAFPLAGKAHAAGASPTFTPVIDNNADYGKLFASNLVKKSCSSAEAARAIVPVDFSRNTVIGLLSSGTCADTGFRRQVVRDDGQKTITYTVAPVAGTKRACMGPGPTSLNLIAIPKLPSGYRVVFQTAQE